MKLLVLLLSCWVTGQAAVISVFDGLPQNAGSGNQSMNFSGDTFDGSFIANDISFGTGPLWTPFGLTANFGADITATISVASAGDYTFNTTSDDGSLLFIDGQLVVNNNFSQGETLRSGTITLSAGQHTMEVQYYQGGGGDYLTATLPAGVSYVADQFNPEGLPLLNIYQDPGPLGSLAPPLLEAGATLAGSIPTTNVNFGATTSNWFPFGLTQNFSAEMLAYFVIPTSGFYTFSTGSDDASYLFIDGQMVVNNGFFQGYTVRQGTVYLTAGSHPFDLQFFQGGGGAALSMGVPAGVVTVSTAPEAPVWSLLPAPLALAAWALRRRAYAAGLRDRTSCGS
jgi:hypothetical protein